MTVQKIADETFYVGAEDSEIEFFENQYPLRCGVTYNSYVIDDEKICVMDSVDERCCEQWMKNLSEVLGDRKPDYLVISHLECDHSGSVSEFLRKYPDTAVVASEKAFSMLAQFADVKIADDKKIAVKENDSIQAGSHKISFIAAPFVHWPEVIMSFDEKTQVLYSADAFGTFDIPSTLIARSIENAAGWKDEARRYFVNIVGKYGQMVLNLLKKIGDIDYKIIAPLHGPVLAGQLHNYSKLYRQWASSEPEEKGVLIVYSTLHGHTKTAAEKAAELIRAKNIECEVFDLAHCDLSSVVSLAFKYDRILFAAPTYDGSVMPCINEFNFRLKTKNLAGRKIALIENGSWAPQSAQIVSSMLAEFKDLSFCQKTDSIRTRLTPENEGGIAELIDELCE